MEKETKFNLGDKIYYMSYEEDNASYTIVGVNEVKDDSYLRTGIHYTVHSDSLPNAIGYYNIHENSIDTDNRFFSSPELAHEAYGKWKEKTERGMR